MHEPVRLVWQLWPLVSVAEALRIWEFWVGAREERAVVRARSENAFCDQVFEVMRLA